MTAQNELDKNAKGGTELLGAALEARLSDDLKSQFQIIRSRVRQLEGNKKHVLWLHDLAQDPEAAHLRDPLSRVRFRKLVFVSHWQQQQYHDMLGVPFHEGVVIPNAIEPIRFLKPWQDHASCRVGGPIRLIYHSTPHRGLELLLPVFDALCEDHPDIHLDVFSSFKLYGWEQRDQPYEHLFEFCRQHPKITYHGTQPNEVIREALKKAHIFAYPCIWLETSCLCAIEAMSAGTIMVAPGYGALPETMGGLTETYAWSEDKQEHVNRFYRKLNEVITNLKANNRHYLKRLEAAQQRVELVNSWDVVVPQWTQLLRSL